MKTISLHLDEAGTIAAIRIMGADGVAEALPPETELAGILGEATAAALLTTEAATEQATTAAASLAEALARVAELEAQLEATAAALAQSTANDSDSMRALIREELAAQGLAAKPSLWSRIFGS